MVTEATALPGRTQPISILGTHVVLGTSMVPPFPRGAETVQLGLGCFWGAERVLWQLEGVFTTAVGYSGGFTPNPTYEEVCSGLTGHAETVLVVFDPEKLPFESVMKTFWEAHDPTQEMRQGNDVGTQYRSVVLVENDRQKALVEASKKAYAAKLAEAGYGPIATRVERAGTFYYAEDYHQQYLAKNPGGYCGLGGTGITCPTGVTR